jgi:hypothetical protein
MRRKTPVILSVAGAVGMIAYRRALLQLASSAFARGLKSLALASAPPREHISEQELLKLRSASEEWHSIGGRQLFGRLLERIKTEYDSYKQACGKGRRWSMSSSSRVGATGEPSEWDFSKAGRRYQRSTRSPCQSSTRSPE